MRRLAAHGTDRSGLFGRDDSGSCVEDGISVSCIGPSTINGLFEGEVGAAIYKTSRGVFEALFLPQSRAFDELQIRERRDGASYLYSFEGPPKSSTADPMTASRPFHSSRT
jgi:hypothetical protein